MKVVDKRPRPIEKEFGELPIGAVFEFLVDGGTFMKIDTADTEENAIDLADCSLFCVSPSDLVFELNAHLVVEG